MNAPTDIKVFDQYGDEPKEMETLEDHFESGDTTFNLQLSITLNDTTMSTIIDIKARVSVINYKL